MVSYGQAGIAVRNALTRGDAEAAARAVHFLDDAHRVELLLGAVIRRADLVGAEHWASGELDLLCRRLAVPAATHLDDLAISFVLRRIAPERWSGEGRDEPLSLNTMEDVAVALKNGFGGKSILQQMMHRCMYRAVSDYYALGSIHALGVRPLLILVAR